MRTRREFSISHPDTAGGVPSGKVDAAKERYHCIAVLDAVKRGYPVPDRVCKDYAWESEQAQPAPEPSTAKMETEIEPQVTTSEAEETIQPTNDHPYTDENVAAYEDRWDLYLETGSLNTVRKTVRRIDAVGILWLALEHVSGKQRRCITA